MEATYAEPALDRYWDSATELMEAGEQVRAARAYLAPVG